MKHVSQDSPALCRRSDEPKKHDHHDYDDEDDEEILGSDDDEQEDPRDYCKGGDRYLQQPVLYVWLIAVDRKRGGGGILHFIFM